MHILHMLFIFCILFAYYFAYYCAYFAYRITCILCIFCILLYIFDAYYFAYSYAYSAYFRRCILCILCILNYAYCAYSAYSGWKKSQGNQGFHCLLPLALLLGPPSQGPAVHVPPLTTITTVCWFIAERSIKVSCFSTHGKWYCPCSTHWNKRKSSQYGGHWNHIQNLCLFPAFVDDCRLTLSKPGWGG